MPHQRLERNLKVLHIGRGALVQDHEIDGELLHPQIFVRAKQLAGDVDVLDVAMRSRQIGRSPEMLNGPEPRLGRRRLGRMVSDEGLSGGAE